MSARRFDTDVAVVGVRKDPVVYGKERPRL